MKVVSLEADGAHKGPFRRRSTGGGSATREVLRRLSASRQTDRPGGVLMSSGGRREGVQRGVEAAGVGGWLPGLLCMHVCRVPR